MGYQTSEHRSVLLGRKSRMLARCDRMTELKAPSMHTDHQIGLPAGEIAERPARRAYLPVHPGGLAGAWWHRFGLGGHSSRRVHGGAYGERGPDVRRSAAD